MSERKAKEANARAGSKGAKSKAAKAAAETAPEKKSIVWEGMTLDLPDDAPGGLLFDFYDFEESQRTGSERIGPVLDLVRSLVGDDQFEQIRVMVKKSGTSLEETFLNISNLLSELLEQYGMALGESSASQDS